MREGDRKVNRLIAFKSLSLSLDYLKEVFYFIFILTLNFVMYVR